MVQNEASFRELPHCRTCRKSLGNCSAWLLVLAWCSVVGRQQVCGMQGAEGAEPAGRCLVPHVQFLLLGARWRLGLPCPAFPWRRHLCRHLQSQPNSRWRDMTARASNRSSGFRPHYDSNQWKTERGAEGAGPAASLAEARGPSPASPPTPASAASASRASPAAAGAAPAAEQEPDGQRSPAAPAAAESPGPQVWRGLGGDWGWGSGWGAGAGPGAAAWGRVAFGAQRLEQGV